MTVDKTYFWRVRAFDGFEYGSFSQTRNFTTQSLLIVSLPINAIEFGGLGLDDEKNTTTESPAPIVIQNDGNIPINITITGTNLWGVQSNPTSYFQFKIDENETNSYSSATTTFTNINQTRNITDVTNLNYSDISDSVELHLKIKVPPLETAGNKSSIITVDAE